MCKWVYITPNFTQGMMQNTGRNLDLAIQGDGFFIYNNGTERLYSREGSLSFDSSGYLVNTASGLRIQGWMADTRRDRHQFAGRRYQRGTTIPSPRHSERRYRWHLNSDTAVGGTISTTMGVVRFARDLHTVTVNFIAPPQRTGAGRLTRPLAPAAAQ